METISKLFTLLQSKIKQFIKNHIIDKCPEEYDDIFQLMETQDLIAIIPISIIMMVLGIVIGMYITTQISDWIDKRRKNG